MYTKIDKPYLTLGEVQSFLGCSRAFVYKQFRKGLKRSYIDKRTYVKTADLIALFKPVD